MTKRLFYQQSEPGSRIRKERGRKALQEILIIFGLVAHR